MIVDNQFNLINLLGIGGTAQTKPLSIKTKTKSHPIIQKTM